MMPSTPNGSDPLVQHLRALVQQSPDLKDAASRYEKILPLLRDADLRAATVSISPEQAHAKLVVGLPLLYDVELELDYAEAHMLMLRLANALEKVSGNGRDACRRIREALEEGRLEVGTLLSCIAAGDQGTVASAAQCLKLDAGFVWTLAQNAFKPALHSWCRQLAPLLEGITWNKGYCPVCGSIPILGELQDNHLSKHLRCGQCSADWPFHRLQCLYCGNEDHHTLGYLYEEPRHEKMMVEVCNQCRGYLKVIVSFTPIPPQLLPVEDLATLRLDYIAEKHGYARVDLKVSAHSQDRSKLEVYHLQGLKSARI
jgi:formate dehydrogenase accessory protein FdhE